MSYTKHNFTSGSHLYASQLNEIDNQIALNESNASYMATHGYYNGAETEKGTFQLSTGNIASNGTWKADSYKAYVKTDILNPLSTISFDTSIYNINVVYIKNDAITRFTSWISTSPYQLGYTYAFDNIAINIKRVDGTVIQESDKNQTVSYDTKEYPKIGNLATLEYVNNNVKSIVSESLLDNSVKIPYPKAFVSRLKPIVYKSGSIFMTDTKPEDFKISGANECYVSTNGNDSNDGSEESPYLTITKAISSGATTIYLKSGTYISGTHFSGYPLFNNKNLIGIGDVSLVNASSSFPRTTSSNVYVENITFDADSKTTSSYNAKIGNSNTVVFNKCAFKNSTGNGLSIEGGNCYCFDCKAYSNTLDGFNYHANGTSIPSVVEVNCKGYNNGDGSTDSCNGSTIHDGASIVRLNGEYYNCYGGVVADKGYDENTPSYSLNFGVISGTSTHTQETLDKYCASFWSQMYCKMWLFDCIAYGSKYDISCYDNATVYAMNLVSEDVFNPSDYTGTGGTIVRK